MLCLDVSDLIKGIFIIWLEEHEMPSHVQDEAVLSVQADMDAFCAWFYR